MYKLESDILLKPSSLRLIFLRTRNESVFSLNSLFESLMVSDSINLCNYGEPINILLLDNENIHLREFYSSEFVHYLSEYDYAIRLDGDSVVASMYEDKNHPINKYRTRRENLDSFVKFID